VSAREPLPSLVLRCRPAYLLLYGATAVLLLAGGAACLAGLDAAPSRAWLSTLAPPILLGLGGTCAYFVARYCFARLVLDDAGFRLIGPLETSDVPWASVIRWERRTQRGGPATLRVVHGPEGRRLSIPLIYEDCHILEVGLRQGGFPQF
jgi:hypothetical protein